MIEFLLNNSVFILFALCAGFVGTSEYRRYLRQNNLTPKEFRSLVRLKLDAAANGLVLKLVASAILTVVISLVSFRELWMNDAFHIVFLTNLLYKPVSDRLKILVS